MSSFGGKQRPVLVLDFGGQYVQLIARRVREQKSYAVIVRHDVTAERVRELDPLAIILSGSPWSVYDPKAPRCDPKLFKLGIPILGICYGLQLAVEAIDGSGSVHPSPAREFGRTECRIVRRDDPLFEGVPPASDVWMSHGDQVHDATDSFEPLATTATCPVAAVRHKHLPIYGLQFHPEVAHTPFGSRILGNFLRTVCKSPGDWTMERFLEQAVAGIQERVGPKERVICGLSGGVDSAVTACSWPGPSVHESFAYLSTTGF